MKFTRNALAPLTITAFFLILSISVPFCAVYALFHPEEAVTSLWIILIILLAAAALNVLAEFTAWCGRNRAALTVTLGEEALTIARKAGKKITIQYSDIKSMEFDMGHITYRRRRSEKFAEPRLELFGDKGKSLSVLTSPSLLMIYHIKKKAPHAKISRTILAELLLPAAFAALYLVIFTISNLV